MNPMVLYKKLANVNNDRVSTLVLKRMESGLKFNFSKILYDL